MIVSKWFQILFHSDHLSSFHLSLTVLSSIGHWVVFRLGGWSLLLQTGFLVSGPTPVPPVLTSLRLREFYPLRLYFPVLFSSLSLQLFGGPLPLTASS